MSDNEHFRFNLDLWRKTLVQEPPVVPEGADLRLIVDPSYTAEEASKERTRASDKSGLVVAYKSERETGGIDLNLLDGSCGRFKGIALAEEIVRLSGLWNPSRIRIERHGAGAYDLLADAIRLLARGKGFVIQDLGFFIPNNSKRAKPNRIRKIETDLLDVPEGEPPALRIYSVSLFGAIMEQAEKFAFDSPTNFERDDSLLDCISLAAFRGEL